MALFHSFSELGTTLFPELSDNNLTLATLRELRGLHRYETEWEIWGTNPALVVSDPYSDVRTAIITSSQDEGAAIVCIVVRGLPDPPPPHGTDTAPGLPHLRWPQGARVDATSPAAPDSQERLRYIIWPGHGARLGYRPLADGRWSVDHIEFYPPQSGLDWMLRQRSLPPLEIETHELDVSEGT